MLESVIDSLKEIYQLLEDGLEADEKIDDLIVFWMKL
mgnify:CR=1 FL=1